MPVMSFTFSLLNRNVHHIINIILAIIIFLFFIFIHNKVIHIHMTYNNTDNNQREIITMLQCL